MKDAHEEKDDFLKDLLQSAGPERTSPDFMANLMAQVETEAITQSKRQVSPVISLKGWIVMATGFVAVIVLAFLFPSTNTQPLPGQEIMAETIEKSADFFGNLHFSSLLVMATAIMAVLFGLDRFVFRRGE